MATRALSHLARPASAAVPWHLLRPQLPLPTRTVRILLAHADSIETVLQLHEEHAAQFDALNVGTFWRSVGWIANIDPAQAAWARGNEGDDFAPVRSTTVRLAPELAAGDLSACVVGIWSSGLGRSPAWDDTWRRLEMAALARVADFNATDLQQVAQAFARVPERGDHAKASVLDAIAGQLLLPGRGVQPGLGGLLPREVVGIARAYGAAGHQVPELTKLLLLHATRSLGSFTPPQLTLLFHAFCKLGAANEAVRAGLLDAVVGSLASLDARSLPVLAWSLARARINNPALYLEVSSLCGQRGLDNFSPSDLAALAHAYSVAPFSVDDLADGASHRGYAPPSYVPELFEAIAQAAARQRRDLGPFEITSLARSFWVAEAAGRAFPLPELFELFAEAARRRLAECTARELSTLAFTFSKVGLLDGPLLDDLLNESGPRLGQFKAKELAALAGAMCDAGGRASKEVGFLRLLGAELYNCQTELTEEERSSVARYYVAMRLPQPVDAGVYSDTVDDS